MVTLPRRAFTLIELVIAVAITAVIAVVAGVAIVEVRNNSNDKAIQSNLEAIQLRAELYYREHQEYNSGSTQLCSTGMFTDPVIAQALATADQASPRGIGTHGIHCRVTPNLFGIWVQRPDGSPTPYWCVDSRDQSCGVNLGLQSTPNYQPCDCVPEE